MCDRHRCVVVQAGVARRSPGVRDALILLLTRPLSSASLQCVWCRTRRRENELKCGCFFFEHYLYVFPYCINRGQHASHKYIRYIMPGR